MWDTGVCSRQTVGVDPPDMLRSFAFPINALLCRERTASVTHEERERHANAQVKPLDKKSQGGEGGRVKYMKDNEIMKINWLH